MSDENMNMIKFGPAAGGNGGTVWDEKGKSEIAKIFVSDNGAAVCSLQFLYVENGHFVSSALHGTADQRSSNFSAVVLDYPSEFLTWVRGVCYFNALRSITFGTNKSSYGPYGSKLPGSDMTKFNFQIGEDRAFGGFHGTKNDNVITSIGIYVKTVTSRSMVGPRISRFTPRATSILLDQGISGFLLLEEE